MEFLAFLLVAGIVLVVVGAIMGMIAKSETGALDRRLDAMEQELRALRRKEPGKGNDVARGCSAAAGSC